MNPEMWVGLETSRAEWIQTAVATADPDLCVEWPWARANGYGAVVYHGRMARVTHIVLAATGREWHPPLGPCCLHSCDNPPCCNPHHLRWGTDMENSLDRRRKGRRLRGVSPMV